MCTLSRKNTTRPSHTVSDAYVSRIAEKTGLPPPPPTSTDTKALAVSGEDARILNNRGAVYHAQLKFSHARDDYDAALVSNASFEQTYINRAQLNIQRNDAYSASKDLSAVLVSSDAKGGMVDMERETRHKCECKGV